MKSENIMRTRCKNRNSRYVSCIPIDLLPPHSDFGISTSRTNGMRCFEIKTGSSLMHYEERQNI